jgi:hypothetical protein
MERPIMITRTLLLAAATLGLAALAANDGAPRTRCVEAPPVNGECEIKHYRATFASATGSINGDTIVLSGGWVFLRPHGGGGSHRREAVVTTGFVRGGVGAAPIGPGVVRPSFLVIAYQNQTALAVTSGTMGTPGGVAAGCEVMYGSSGEGTPFALSTDQGVVGILNGLGVSFPGTCPQS